MRLGPPPRWARMTFLVLVVVLGSLVYGVTTASTPASLGPHNAEYSVTVNSVVTVDLGPLGSVVLQSPLPGGLGVTVTIEEIPNDLTSVESGSTLEALASDVQGYLQFFGGPDETISYVTRALVEDAISRTVAMLLVALALGVAGYFVLGDRRREELGAAATQHTWAIVSAVTITAVVGTVVVTDRAQTRLDEVGEEASAVFAGTPLEGARITGRLSGVIDTYGGQLISVYRQNEDFYAGADRNLAAAWAARAERDDLAAARLRDTTASSGEDARDGAPGAGQDGPPGSAATEEPADGRDDAAERPTEGPDSSADDSDVVTLLLVSDLHCNTGMSPLIETAARLSGAEIILNGGDTTINGTSVERFCVESFAGAVPDGARMVQADGNHDSTETSAQARDAGVLVLDGEIVEVAGMRILGDRDPKETRIGQGSASVTGETYTEAGERLAEVACAADEPVDLLLIHTPAVGTPVLESGCAPVQISGHTHTRQGPVRQGAGVLYVSGSTAGSVSGQATVGPLNGDAEMTVFRFDRTTRTMLDYRVIRVSPDGSAQVGARLAFPTPDPDAAGAEEGAADDEPGTDEPGTDAAPDGSPDSDEG